MKKRIISYLLIIALAGMLSSCAKAPSCSELLISALEVSGESCERNGLFYFSEAIEGEAQYLSPQVIKSLYGEDAAARYFSLVEDFAIFVSQRTPGVLAILKCYSRSDTDEIAGMCLQRADAIKVGLRKSEYAEKSKSICVRVYKSFVVLHFVENVQKTEEMISGSI